MTTNNSKGAFLVSLQRNYRQIRADRALSISEDAEMLYKRKIEVKNNGKWILLI